MTGVRSRSQAVGWVLHLVRHVGWPVSRVGWPVNCAGWPGFRRMQLQNSGFRPGPRRKCPTSDALTGFAVTEVKLVASSGSWGTNFSENLVNASEVGHRRRITVRERGISRQGDRKSVVQGKGVGEG